MSEADNLCYLIENKIVFLPEKQCLVHTDSHEEIKLKPTASLCLLLLLRNHTKIVTQNELLAFAWGESHRQVSFNAFYQSILSLRKSFLQMNVEKQIITTIPRKGLIIQQEITVEKKRDHVVPEVEIELTEPHAVTDTNGIENKKLPKVNLAEALIIMFTIIIVGVLIYPKVSSENYFSGYVASKKYDGQCHYFLNDDASNHIRHEDFIKQHPEMCSDDKYLYITAYPETKNISIITCTTNMELSHDNSCQSVYYPRYDSK
ncbi:winged helix-turn-helix domain-containing protein [Buttiauxella sp. A2-C1_F]|uniref:winged helix-turn-helix domain-containing protein n=1 Tax=unclassified Buttiauxella TaxID=2634062 RepID=UPI001E41C275|nr:MULTISPECIES: winged helix-turn-helix domain-containing protein [unclassified Buttiauxella]MCE0801150.1 winged helix-turn-helix domain-containing protein [Buttiauxella sp. W03-F01]MCE0811772.1 winged helix-turn-helix domain-containing protein [Buttiauxella sp. S04-F03]MCE0845469.1 winged helix-turn-helix domain-containing protein [Buttiauxella sp. A2-C1_F]